MVTAEEIAAISLFAPLTDEARVRLSRVAADVTLMPGEYAAQEGDPGALYALLDGRIEPTKLVDGVPRPLGERLPGDVFGEVPIVLGTVFPVGFRATEKSRVLKIQPRDYFSLAAVEPSIANAVGQLAANRMSGPRGLQGIAAVETTPRAFVLGHRWDAVTGELRRFLDRNQVSFTWIPADEPTAAEEWGGAIPEAVELPMLRVVDGKTVVRPQHRHVAELLGVQTEPRSHEYDVIVVGAGPAGLAAGVYGASEGLRTIAIEREAPGGQAGTSSRIENYLGFPNGLSGDELASRALLQGRRLGAEILVTREINRIDTASRQVHLDGGDVLNASTIILACGVAWRRLEIDGFERLAGKGISYGAARGEAPNVHGLDIHIIGAGNSAGQAAMFFASHAKSVTILCRGSSLRKSMSQYLIEQIATRPDIEVMYRTQVVAAHGEEKLEALDVQNADTGEVSRLHSSGLFIFIGADAETGWLPPEIALDERGYVLTGADVRAAGVWELERDPYLLETSVPGIFACGDVRSGPVKRVAAAVGEGSMAIAFVHQYLREIQAAEETLRV